MNKKINVRVNGNLYEVEIDGLPGPDLQAWVNGTAYPVSLETGQGSLPIATVSETPVRATPAAPAPRPVAAAPRAAAATNAVTAPMPGVVLDITVRPGQKVTRGQQLCALEAMKMKNAIRSPQDGVVAAVEVTDGQRVAFGTVLVRFE